MEKQRKPTEQKPTEPPVEARQQYNEPLLLKHDALRDITGQKYGEKSGIIEKPQVES